MLSKSTQYAIRALVYVQLKNREKYRPGVGEIAREIEAPEAYTAKILQMLTRHRLLSSMKGRGGGFFFDEDHTDVTLHKVILIMEGDSAFYRCGFGLKNCNDDHPCPLHHQYIGVRDKFLEIAQTQTIQSLAQNIEDGKAVLNRLVINDPPDVDIPG